MSPAFTAVKCHMTHEDSERMCFVFVCDLQIPEDPMADDGLRRHYTGSIGGLGSVMYICGWVASPTELIMSELEIDLVRVNEILLLGVC